MAVVSILLLPGYCPAKSASQIAFLAYSFAQAIPTFAFPCAADVKLVPDDSIYQNAAPVPGVFLNTSLPPLDGKVVNGAVTPVPNSAPAGSYIPAVSDNPTDFTWSSSNPSVATISNGVATLVAVGSTTITATASSINSNAVTLTVTSISPAQFTLSYTNGGVAVTITSKQIIGG